jgi:hypothetical protein
MPRLIVELDPPLETPVSFSSDTAPLVYFLSFAFAARYGSQHELTKAALLLRGGAHKLDLKPLLTFADRDAEEPVDQRDLERAWQDAVPLAECCRAVVAAIDADAAVRDLLVDFPTLRDLLDELSRIAAYAAAEDRRIRLTYSME